MNRPCSHEGRTARLRFRRWPPGQSAAELALIAPILLLLLLASADFARVFYMAIAVNNAARAGAQYGSQTVITAADSQGMAAAAKSDGSNVPNLTATASQCTCEASTTVTACSASYCTNNPTATFVEVDTSAPFQTLVTYPGIPSSLTLSGKAIMAVQQ
jgi:Flp pilus assembly protein TadG